MNDLIPSQLGNGPVVDLGKAIGILDANGNLDTSWFSNPGDRMADLLTSPDAADHERRQALLRALSQLFDDGASSLRDDTWSLALGDSGVDLLIRASPSDGGPAAEVEIGIGGRWLLHAAGPKLELEAQFGVLVVDTDSGKITPAEGIDASLVLGDFGAGSANVLDGVAVDIHLPFHDPEKTTASLRLVGVGPDNEDISFTLDTSPTWTDFEDPLLRLVVLALVVLADQLSGDAATAVSNLLALFGWKQDPTEAAAAYPGLSLDALLANPGLALQQWLQDIWEDIDDDIADANNKVRLFLKRLMGMLRADTALTVESDGRYVLVRPNTAGPLRFELLMWAEADAAGAQR
ncbi:MAG: hypothetical protein KC431_11570, partial [Myxococcales bacterium]|nr:hypothetical protein [Myxococcales bacterium]